MTRVAKAKEWARRDPGCAYAAFMATLTFGIVVLHMLGWSPDEVRGVIREVGQVAGTVAGGAPSDAP